MSSTQNTATTVNVGIYPEEGSMFRVDRTPSRWTELGPVRLSEFTGRAHIQHHLEVVEAEALIAALQIVVDDVESEEGGEGSVMGAADELLAACDRFDAVRAEVGADGC